MCFEGALLPINNTFVHFFSYTFKLFSFWSFVSTIIWFIGYDTLQRSVIILLKSLTSLDPLSLWKIRDKVWKISMVVMIRNMIGFLVTFLNVFMYILKYWFTRNLTQILNSLILGEFYSSYSWKMTLQV